MILDTLKLKTKLEHAGMDDQLAVVIADALGNADVDQLATKADLRTEIDTVKADIATVKADLYRALWIQWGATVAAVTAIVTISKLF